mmetsp:Transcript_27482/g.42353  ORF Transcript_27482/g.42353 Transcript_27482/m.42353 type:complete len:353 (+) Transcript_27482:38-1096(+)
MTPICSKLMYLQFILAVSLLIPTTCSAFLGGHLTRSPFRARLSTSASVEEVDIHDLQSELNSEGLNLCHGIMHASGVRELSDIQYLTEDQILEMGIDQFDKQNIKRVQERLSNDSHHLHQLRELSTKRDGAFDRKVLSRFEVEERQDFDIRTICSENDVYTGQLFSIEQCEQLNRMSEHYAYKQIGTINSGWTDQIYTLTAQHMACKDVPGMIPSTQIIMRQLIQELYGMFPEIVPGSICYENDGEPHLVKYNGKAKGTVAHTDNSEYKFITVNAILSGQDEYSGGGTYITVLDKTIKLSQGQVLIHLGDLEHAGADIKSGVRRLFIAFFACRWKDDLLNKPILENARDFEG